MSSARERAAAGACTLVSNDSASICSAESLRRPTFSSPLGYLYKGMGGRRGVGRGKTDRTQPRKPSRQDRARAWTNGDRTNVSLAGKPGDGWFKIELPYQVIEHMNTTGTVAIVCERDGRVSIDPIYEDAGHYKDVCVVARGGGGGAGDAVEGAGGGGTAVGADNPDGADGDKGEPAL